MPKRGENIHKRKDGRWEGRYIKRRDNAGKAIYGSIYGKTYKEVKQKMFEIMKNTKKIHTLKELKCVEEVLEIWLEANQIRLKASTITKYQYLIKKHIVPELGNIPISQLTVATINTFLNNKIHSGRLDQKGGLSASYVKSIMLIIQSAMEFAIREEWCLPMKNEIVKPTLPKNELIILSCSEQKKLEQYLLKDIDETKLGILLSLNAGLRIGEICSLKWEDIDLVSGIIHVNSTLIRIKRDTAQENTSCWIVDTPKTASSLREIPISSTLLPILQQCATNANSQYVVSNKADFISPRTYEYRYHKILEICNIPSINYHALRHTFATRCVEVGVDIKTLSEILGHANVSITLNTYVHSSMELKRKQIEKLSLLGQ